MPLYPTLRRAEADESAERELPPSYPEGMLTREANPRRGRARPENATTAKILHLVPLLLLFNLITTAMTLSAVFYLVGKAYSC